MKFPKNNRVLGQIKYRFSVFLMGFGGSHYWPKVGFLVWNMSFSNSEILDNDEMVINFSMRGLLSVLPGSPLDMSCSLDFDPLNVVSLTWGLLRFGECGRGYDMHFTAWKSIRRIFSNSAQKCPVATCLRSPLDVKMAHVQYRTAGAIRRNDKL